MILSHQTSAWLCNFPLNHDGRSKCRRIPWVRFPRTKMNDCKYHLESIVYSYEKWQVHVSNLLDPRSEWVQTKSFLAVWWVTKPCVWLRSYERLIVCGRDIQCHHGCPWTLHLSGLFHHVNGKKTWIKYTATKTSHGRKFPTLRLVLGYWSHSMSWKNNMTKFNTSSLTQVRSGTTNSKVSSNSQSTNCHRVNLQLTYLDFLRKNREAGIPGNRHNTATFKLTHSMRRFQWVSSLLGTGLVVICFFVVKGQQSIHPGMCKTRPWNMGRLSNETDDSGTIQWPERKQQVWTASWR